MGKSPPTFSSFPRRVFQMTLRFDRDRELPHVVTFPFSEPVSDILDPDGDLQDFSHPSLAGHDFNATPSISGLGPCDQAPPGRDRDLPGANEKAAGVVRHLMSVSSTRPYLPSSIGQRGRGRL
jgi:hypothetical protein